MDQLEPPKKVVNKSKDFRSFMRTQKKDLSKMMVLETAPMVVGSQTLTKAAATEMLASPEVLVMAPNPEAKTTATADVEMNE